MPLERMRCSSSATLLLGRRPLGLAEQLGGDQTVHASTSGITTLPVTSPPITITGASYTRGAWRNFRQSTSVPWMSEA